MLEQLSPGTVGGHEPLHALAGEHFARIEIALGVGGFHMKAEEASTVLTLLAQRAHDFARLAIEEPDVVVRQVGDVEQPLFLVVREHHAAGRSAHARRFGQLEFLLEVALLVGDVNPVARAVGRIDQAVVGEIEGQVADELLGHRTTRRVGMVLRLRADLGQLVAVRAPAPLELELVQREHHDAAAEGIVRHIDLVDRIVGTDLFDAAHDHRRCRRVLGDEG